MKKLISKTAAVSIYLNYYFLTKVSLFFFPFVAVYAILFNRSIVQFAISVGVCTYCLYFQGYLAKTQLKEANNKKEVKEIVKNSKLNSFVNILCLLLGIICLYFAWIDFFVHLVGVENFKNFVDNKLM
jgi:uncharacterized membrane protein